MKRIFILIFSLFFLAGCCSENTAKEESPVRNENSSEENTEFRGIWLPIYEIAPDKKNKKDYENQIEKMMKDISEFGFTDVFVQVRANCDSIYRSEVFSPCRAFAENEKLCFDALDIMINAAHRHSLKLHAWINPYRVTADIKKHPADIPDSIKDDDLYENGKARYLNPCSENTNKVILDGIREIIESYKVDGIHIDDYFYPSQDEKIDEREYGAYRKSGGKYSLSEYRRNTVSLLVSSIYSLVKSENEKIMFSVSPSADIYKNRNSLYADVEKWCSERGYCDMIIPQIYFGFENESMPFAETLQKWMKMTKNGTVRLSAGLAIYKCGREDKYAGESGKNEWIKNSDIIKRQVEYLRKNNADGFAVFSYNYVFGNRNFTNEEVQNLKNVL